MRKVLAAITVLVFVFAGQVQPASAGTKQTYKSELGLVYSWSNPSVKPNHTQSVVVKVTVTNSSSTGYWYMRMGLTDADGLDAGSLTEMYPLGPGKSHTFNYEIYGFYLDGTKAPYRINFQADGNNGIDDVVDYTFAFEVPTSIHCYKKGKAKITVKKYKPVCPAGYKKVK